MKATVTKKQKSKNNTHSSSKNHNTTNGNNEQQEAEKPLLSRAACRGGIVINGICAIALLNGLISSTVAVTTSTGKSSTSDGLITVLAMFTALYAVGVLAALFAEMCWFMLDVRDRKLDENQLISFIVGYFSGQGVIAAVLSYSIFAVTTGFGVGLLGKFVLFTSP